MGGQNCDLYFLNYLELQFPYALFCVCLVNEAAVTPAPVWFHV